MISRELLSATLDCRQFAALLAADGLTMSRTIFAQAKIEEPEVLRFSRNGWVPNNDRLPVLIYHGVFEISDADPAANFEQVFHRSGWSPQRLNGIYDFHHYHSTAHEVLGIAGGQARIVLGGPNGYELKVSAGDVLVLPTGTGHCRLQSSGDFLVVGGYPPSQSWDICRSAPSQAERERMRTLPFPLSDPLTGPGGALTRLWCPRMQENAKS